MPRRSARDPRSRAGLPSYRDLVEFLRANPQALTAREIARAFGLGPADGPALRGLLRAIERSGEVVRGPDRKFAAGGVLPEIAPYRAGRQRFRRVSAGSPDRLVGRGRGAAVSPDRGGRRRTRPRRARPGAAHAGRQRRGRGRDHPAHRTPGRRGEPGGRRVPPHPRRRRHHGGGSPRQDRIPRRWRRMPPACPTASWSWPRSSRRAASASRPASSNGSARPMPRTRSAG